MIKLFEWNAWSGIENREGGSEERHSFTILLLQDHVDIGTTTRQSHLQGVAFPLQDDAAAAIQDLKRNKIQYLQLVSWRADVRSCPSVCFYNLCVHLFTFVEGEQLLSDMTLQYALLL